jgi:lambda repressor-like predicted transcriptional regulator
VETATEQIIGAKVESRAFIMRDLSLSARFPASLNSVVGPPSRRGERHLAETILVAAT